MVSRSTSVATEALAYCTSCKMDLNHVIVAMKGERIAKVQCCTCKKEHVYRTPKGVNEPKLARGARAEAVETAHSIEIEWEKLMNAHRSLPFKAYQVKGLFDLGDKLTHSSFGEGIVSKLIYPNKLEVIFRNDIKILIHAGVPLV